MSQPTFRHARTSISSRRGGLPIQPIPGGRGGEPQGCSAFGESIGYADGHHLKTLLTWVRNMWLYNLLQDKAKMYPVFFLLFFLLLKKKILFTFDLLSICACSDMFNITNMRGKVAKFCIFKTMYRLGEDIIGTFNFSEGDIPCLQVCFFFLLPIKVLSNFLQITALIFCMFCLVLSESSEWGGDPVAVPAAPWTGHKCDHTWTAYGVLPSHCLQPLLSSHPPQCHARFQQRRRSVSVAKRRYFRYLFTISPWQL